MQESVTEEYVKDLLDRLTLPFGDGNAGVMAYHNTFVRRYANTLGELSALPRDLKVLELAANPYGMTAALACDFFDDLRLASFGAIGAVNRIRFSVGERAFDLEERCFNVELDFWPYDDGEFDLIISCEMIEHLAMDPMHVFAEANRVLKPEGRFLVSTPNASSLQNAVKSLRFKTASLAPHYRTPGDLSGIYQRHNREMTPLVLGTLFTAAGFREERYETVDNYPFFDFGADPVSVEVLRALYGPRWRGDTLNFTGIKAGPLVERFPEHEELYVASDHA